MSRFKQFTRSMMSSYAHLVVNVFYTLASVPLALKYLSKAEFGLWAVVLQISGYIALVDLGMGTSVARILIDHKDERVNGRYGGALKSAFFVGLAQSVIILISGLSLLTVLPTIFRVRHDLHASFLWLMAGQIVLTAAIFSTRIFSQILYAWQRVDISNYSGIVQLIAGFAALWVGFLSGFGILSLIIGAAAGWFCGQVLNVWACWKLGFLPRKGEWGRASKQQFQELFTYGTDVFLISIGTQLVISSQAIMISRQLGEEAAALWSVMTKVFTLLTQIVWKIVANAMPVFAEMAVRGEWSRLWDRYRQLFLATNVFAGFFGVLFAACNNLFVLIWTRGQFFWHRNNDVLLAVWMILLTQQCCHNSLVMNLKEVRKLKYIFLLEGVVFIGVSLPVLPSTGITGMLACSVMATGLFTWLTGVWQIANLSHTRWKLLLWDWQKPLLKMLLAFVPCWLVVDVALRQTQGLLRLILTASVLSLVGTLLARRAIPKEITNEFIAKLPWPLRDVAFIFKRSSPDKTHPNATIPQ